MKIKNLSINKDFIQKKEIYELKKDYESSIKAMRISAIIVAGVLVSVPIPLAMKLYLALPGVTSYGFAKAIMKDEYKNSVNKIMENENPQKTLSR